MTHEASLNMRRPGNGPRLHPRNAADVELLNGGVHDVGPIGRDADRVALRLLRQDLAFGHIEREPGKPAS